MRRPYGLGGMIEIEPGSVEHVDHPEEPPPDLFDINQEGGTIKHQVDVMGWSLKQLLAFNI